MKASFGDEETEYESIDLSMLNKEQTLAHEVLTQWINKGYSEQLLMHIQGKYWPNSLDIVYTIYLICFLTKGAGGSGKSVVMRVNAKYLKDQFVDHPNFFKIGAPTGTGNDILELSISITF